MNERTAMDEARADLRSWLFNLALPFWSTRGIDRVKGGFIERFTPQGEPLDMPRRARVVGRQIFSFAVAERLGWEGPARAVLRHGLETLFDQHLKAEGVLIATVAAGGAPLGPPFDLYDQAFVLFGLAAAHRQGEQRNALETQAGALLSRMDRWRHPLGGFEEALPRTLPLKANPHMHLFEAGLAWHENTADARWEGLADEMAELCLAHFRDRTSGAVMEVFDGDWRPLALAAGGAVEPGHQFEWGWLLIRWGMLRNRPEAIAIARHLVELAETHGVDRTLDLAINELNPDLTVRDPRARLWPQTERIKAHLALAAIARCEEEAALALDRAARAVRGLMTFFDHPVPGAWWEHRDHEGCPIVEPSRASSLYHIMCAMEVMTQAADR